MQRKWRQSHGVSLKQLVVAMAHRQAGTSIVGLLKKTVSRAHVHCQLTMWYCAFVALSSLPSNNGTQIIVFLEKEVSPQDPPLLKHNQQVAKRREHMIWDTFFVFGPIFFFLIRTTVTMILSNRNGQFFFSTFPFSVPRKPPKTPNIFHFTPPEWVYKQTIVVTKCFYLSLFFGFCFSCTKRLTS